MKDMEPKRKLKAFQKRDFTLTATEQLLNELIISEKFPMNI